VCVSFEAEQVQGEAFTVKSTGTKISCPLYLEERLGRNRTKEPVTVGIPMPQSAIFEASELALLNDKSEFTPLQVQVLSKWFDESIQWVLLDFQASVGPNSVAEYRVEDRVDVKREILPRPISIQRTSSSIRIDTGVATFHLNEGILRPFDLVEVQGVSILEKERSRVVLTDPAGKEYEPKISDITIEAQGPLRATLKFIGTMCNDTTSLGNFIARLTFYAGCNFVKLSFTLHNPGAARHPGGLWDLGDEGSIYFKDLSVHTVLNGD